jgi:hypothetical protein
MKKCSRCKEDKPLSEFSSFKNTLKYPDGKNCWCKLCNREYTHKYDESRREYIRERRRKYEKLKGEEMVISNLNTNTSLFCLYKITIGTSHKFYIGSTVNPYHSYRKHVNRLSKLSHRNKELQMVYNLYGLTNFKYEILSQFDTLEDARKAESILINETFEENYNVLKTKY